MATITTQDQWHEAQRFEQQWWGDCLNTFTEEIKQLTYAYKMGLTATMDWGHWPVYDLQHKNAIDIGGGPTSILLKCVNRGVACIVVDPCRYPFWVSKRYERAGIIHDVARGEDLGSDNESWIYRTLDEAWLYNVLQHVEDPERIIHNARKLADVIRVFEWVDMETNVGHPHQLKAELLDQWLDGTGTVEQLDENHCVGTAYYGVFSGHVT